MKNIASAGFALLLSVAATGVFAQTPAPATPAAPAAATPAAKPAAKPSAPAKMSAADKAALSKKCSADADAQKLHGKARKTFRDKCKKGAM